MSPTLPRRVLPTLPAVAAVVLTLTTAPPIAAGRAQPDEPDQLPRRPGQEYTVAGLGEEGYSGDGWAARDARLGEPLNIDVGPDGTVYIVDRANGRLRRVTPDGVIDTVPGTRSLRAPENDGPNVNGWIYSPSNRPAATAVAADGTVYLAGNDDIRRIERSGRITVLGGGGELTFDPEDGGTGGDGGPAKAAWIYEPSGIDVDDAGSVYVADTNNQRIRRIDRRGRITTIAGGGETPIGSAEGGPATSVRLPDPNRVAVDRDGTVYFSTEQGTTVYGVGADGALTKAAELPGDTEIGGIAVGPDGRLHVADAAGRVHRIAADGTSSDPVAGPWFGFVDDIAVGPDGDVYVAAEATAVRVAVGGDAGAATPPKPAESRWAGEEPGTVRVVAGNGREPAPPRPEEVAARISPPGPAGMTLGPDGTVYVAMPTRHQVLAIGEDGAVREFAGTGEAGAGEDGPLAERAQLDRPTAVAADTEGYVYVADTGNDRIVRVDADTGIIETDMTMPAPETLTVAPTGIVYATSANGERIFRLDGKPVPVAGGGDRWAQESDNAPARQASLWEPSAPVVDRSGTLYFVERGKPAVRAVRPNGVLVTVAGSSYLDVEEGGFGGDGGPATRAELNTPRDVAIGPDGSRYVADTYNNRIRRIDRRGVISTVAGTGERADRGDGGQAAKAALTEPDGIAVARDGTLYVTSAQTSRIRRIARDGTISTLADLAPAGDTERASEVSLGQVQSMDVGADGTLYVTDVVNGVRAMSRDGVLRRVELPGDNLPTVIATGRDGSLYFVHGGNTVRRRYPDGGIVRPPGGGEPAALTGVAIGPRGEVYTAGPEAVFRVREDGTLDELTNPTDNVGGIAVGPDGTVYVAVTNDHRVLAVAGGKAEPVAGNGESYGRPDEERDGRPALESPLSYPSDVAVTSDGALFISTTDGIRRVDTDGVIETVVPAERGRTSPASAKLAVGPGDDLYFVRRNQVRVLVGAAEWEAPSRFPWPLAWWLAGAVAVLAVGVVVLRHRNTTRRALAHPAPAQPDEPRPTEPTPAEPAPGESTTSEAAPGEPDEPKPTEPKPEEHRDEPEARDGG
ncbi:NHL repeat-containing protein [Actinophytocola sp.]|uniref:NHL repeat-containing protein n=1 Tax=Actinophytocola sp. TaxID=1872138 RepID=UPI003D6B28AE